MIIRHDLQCLISVVIPAHSVFLIHFIYNFYSRGYIVFISSSLRSLNRYIYVGVLFTYRVEDIMLGDVFFLFLSLLP